MLTLIGYNIRSTLRNSTVVIWVVVFPILLATLLMVMLGDMTSNRYLGTIELGVVTDDAFASDEATGLRELLAGLASDGGEVLDAAGGLMESSDSQDEDAPLSLALTGYENDGAARQGLLAGEVEMVVGADADGMPELTVPPSSMNGTAESVVQAVLDRYVQASRAASELAAADPEALSAPEAAMQLARDMAGDDVATEQLDIMRVEPRMATRFYYAVLGFSSIMGSNVAALMVERMRANMSPVGMRMQVSSARPARQLLAALMASWLIVFACLVVALAYLVVVAGVSFAGREVLALAACAACALVSCAFGAFIWSLPWPSQTAKDISLTLSTLALSLPAGLYGDPAMALSDWLTAHLPWLQTINPAVQATNAFYTLTYYDSLAPFAATLATLGAMAAVLFGASAFFMRRQRYASL